MEPERQGSGYMIASSERATNIRFYSVLVAENFPPSLFPGARSSSPLLSTPLFHNPLPKKKNSHAELGRGPKSIRRAANKSHATMYLSQAVERGLLSRRASQPEPSPPFPLSLPKSPQFPAPKSPPQIRTLSSTTTPAPMEPLPPWPHTWRETRALASFSLL